MSVSVKSASIEIEAKTTIASGTGAKHPLHQKFIETLKNSSSAWTFDRLLAVEQYSLTTAAGNLDIDLFDLGALDVGAGVGRDNLGLSHANARVLAILLHNRAIDSGGTLRVDNNSATNPWVGLFGSTRVFDLPQGGMVFGSFGENGKTVTDASDHILRLSAQTNDCELDLYVWSAQT